MESSFQVNICCWNKSVNYCNKLKNFLKTFWRVPVYLFLTKSKTYRKCQHLGKSILKMTNCPALLWRALPKLMFWKYSGLLYLATLIITQLNTYALCVKAKYLLKFFSKFSVQVLALAQWWTAHNNLVSKVTKVTVDHIDLRKISSKYLRRSTCF